MSELLPCGRNVACPYCGYMLHHSVADTQSVSARERKLVEALKHAYCRILAYDEHTNNMDLLLTIRLVEPDFGKDAKE